MDKVFTLELDQQGEVVELHLNRIGAEYMRIDGLIVNNQNEHLHLMTPDWGGGELSAELQNLGDNIKLIHQLKIMYWKE